MLDAMQVSTYARYLKDILNQKRTIPKTDRLVFVERCSSAILDGLPDKMGDPGVLTISCLIGELLATWAGHPATYLGWLATPSLPYKRAAKGSLILHRISSKA
jgi:hypothetical protein